MIYEYQCKKCGQIMDVNHSPFDENKAMLFCPNCDRMRPVKKLISMSSFILKGGAWAKDGYAKEKK